MGCYHPRVRRLLLVGTALALALLTGRVHEGLRDRRADFPRDEDLLYLPPPGYLGPMSLGYREALADLIWLRAVIFTGDAAGGQNWSWIMKYIEAITRLAPDFRRPYAWGGVVFIYTGQAIDRSMIERATELYRRGLERYPEDHEMLFALGMLLTRDVPSTPGYTEEEIEAARKEGAAAIRKAAAFGAPPLVRQYAATLVDDDAADELSIQFLETQLLAAEDDGYRRLLRSKLDALIGSQGTAALERTKNEFLGEKDRRLPYVPESLYAVIRADADPLMESAIEEILQED